MICIIYIYIYSYICPHIYGSFLQQSLEHCILYTYGRGHVPWILVAKVHHEPLDLATRQKGTITSRWSAGSVAATAAGCTVRCTGETKWIARLFDGFESEDQLLLEVKISYFWICFCEFWFYSYSMATWIIWVCSPTYMGLTLPTNHSTNSRCHPMGR